MAVPTYTETLNTIDDSRGVRGYRRPELLTDVEVGWLSGLFDGEGCISLHWQHVPSVSGYPVPGYRLFVSNTCKALLDRGYEITGLGKVRARKGKYAEHYLQGYVWDISRRNDILTMLKLMHPWLIAKKRQAEIAIEFISTCRRNNHVTPEMNERRHILMQEMQSLLHPRSAKAGEFGESPDRVTPSRASIEEGVEISPEIMDTSARPEREEMIRAARELAEA